MKNNYITVQIHENEKNYAYVVKATEMDNLLSKLAINNIMTANIFPTKKRAEEIADKWNESFKNNGTYLFD